MLFDKIAEDYKTAMKNKEAIKASTLSFLRSQLKYVVIEKKIDKPDDADVIAVIKKQIKQRQESIAQFEKGGRPDLVEKEMAEGNILKGYLPAEMSVEELKGIVDGVIKETGAAGPKDMGRVMKEVLAKAAGRVDGKIVSDYVKERLSTL